MNQVQDPTFEANLGLDTIQSVTYIREWNGLTTGQKLYLPFKRLMDIVLSAIALIVLAPVFAVVATAIKFDSPGPVFYLQKRCAGKNGKPFDMIKFRSMVRNADDLRKNIKDINMMDGPLYIKSKDDVRITRVGRFIRKFSIDEIPQFVNVFLGSMSLVGPRSLKIIEIEQCISYDQIRRLCVRPGITCFWQIDGRSRVSSFDRRMRMDLDYIESLGLITDLKILLKTIPAVLSCDGAY